MGNGVDMHMRTGGRRMLEVRNGFLEKILDQGLEDYKALGQ